MIIQELSKGINDIGKYNSTEHLQTFEDRIQGYNKEYGTEYTVLSYSHTGITGYYRYPDEPYRNTQIFLGTYGQESSYGDFLFSLWTSNSGLSNMVSSDLHRGGITINYDSRGELLKLGLYGDTSIKLDVPCDDLMLDINDASDSSIDSTGFSTELSLYNFFVVTGVIVPYELFKRYLRLIYVLHSNSIYVLQTSLGLGRGNPLDAHIELFLHRIELVEYIFGIKEYYDINGLVYE